MSSIMPVSDYGKNKEGQPLNQTTRRPPASIIAINDWMKKYAAENGLTYLDYFSAMVDDKGFLKNDISRDGLHPNEKGYEVMKPLAEQAINTALKKKPKK
jgi:lysophospholipase L1-like esterase